MQTRPQIDTAVFVQIPEGIDLELHPAGVMARAAAYGIDLLLRLILLAAFGSIAASLGQFGTGLLLITSFVLEWLYPIVFELASNGQTPGKRALALRVVKENGGPIDPAASVLRNLLRGVDMIPGPYLIAVFCMFGSRRLQRSGDMAAGTLVVYVPTDDDKKASMNQGRAVQAPLAEVPALQLDELQAFIAYARRIDTLNAARARELADIVAPVLLRDNPQSARDDTVTYVLNLAQSLSAGAYSPTRAGGKKISQNDFERRRSPVWNDFSQILMKFATSRATLDDHVAFSRTYRQICHDLSIARSSGFGVDLVAQLNDLVVAGHGHLYRPPGLSVGAFLDFWTRRLPQTFRRKWRLMLAVHGVFYAVAIAAAVMVYTRPDVIFALVDAEQLFQIEESYALEAVAPRGAAGDWQMFGFYINNNIGIDFRTFAGGLLFGVGSLAFLGYNALMLGAMTTHVVNAGGGNAFFSFVAGHSAPELLALLLSAAAGLRLGLTLLWPTNHRRIDALRLQGREVLDLLYGAAALTFLAAWVEAFWSAREASNEVKYAIGVAFWILLYAYFLLGGRRAA